MATVNTVAGDLIVTGHLTPKTMTLPAGVVTDDKIPAGANLPASKHEQQFQPRYAKSAGVTAAADLGEVVHVVEGAAGTLLRVAAGCLVANIGDSTVSVDVHKNGVSVLTAPISLSSSQTARQTVAGSLVGGSVSLAAGDVLEVVVTVSAGTGTLGKGVFCTLKLREDGNT